MKNAFYLIVTTAIIISTITFSSPSLAFWGKLRSPYPIVKYLPHEVEKFNDTESCPNVPPAIHDMEYLSIYTDRTHGLSIVDEQAKARYKNEVRPIKDYETQIYKWSEQALGKYTGAGRPVVCAIEWLNSWGKQDALLNGNTTFQGEAVRKWTIASLSGQYLQIKYLKGIDKKKKKNIEKWLERLGQEVIQNYETNPESTSRNNNHMYWAAWSVMITGVAINDKKFYSWGKKQYFKALQRIQSDGTLPLEIAREGKAFNYHVFAAAPLTMMAETMKRNGDEPYKNGQLYKLMNFILDDLDNGQAYTTEITGVSQNIEGTITSSQLAWLEVYNSRFPDTRAEKWIGKFQPMVQRRIGGNMTRLYNTSE